MGGLGKKLIVAFDTAAVATVNLLLPALPRDLARLAGSVFGAMGLVVSPERRRRALDNLIKIFPNLPVSRLKKIRRECFVQFGAGFAEIYHLHHKKKSYLQRLVNIEGIEYLKTALNKGNGVIVIGSHLSNFPFGMLALASMGYPVAALIRAADNIRVEEISRRIRHNFGLQEIYVKPRQDAARKCTKWLRRGNILWILVDQRNRYGTVVNFLEHPSQVATGAALFARRMDSPAIPIVTVRMKNSRYRVIINREIPLTEGVNRQFNLKTDMERFLEVIGRHILAYPGQWTWFHKMWKVRKEALS